MHTNTVKNQHTHTHNRSMFNKTARAFYVSTVQHTGVKKNVKSFALHTVILRENA